MQHKLQCKQVNVSFYNDLNCIKLKFEALPKNLAAWKFAQCIPKKLHDPRCQGTFGHCMASRAHSLKQCILQRETDGFGKQSQDHVTTNPSLF